VPNHRIRYRLWITGFAILAVAGLFTRVAFVRFVDEKPYAHPEAAFDDVGADAGVVLVTRTEMIAEPVDAGVALVPPTLVPDVIDGPAPGPSWAHRTRNVLLVGVDRKPWGRGGGLADTIIVAALDERSGHVGLISVPRDFYVEFRPGEFGRINTAFHFAAENGMTRGAYLASVVEALLDVPIRETFIVDLTVVERVVDAVGGVEVDVPCAIRDNFVDPRTDTGRRLLDVPVGAVHMDGTIAAMYARSRHGRSDWDRARRQQGVILALRRKVMTFDALPVLPRILDELASHIQTDMSRGDLLELARFGVRVDTNNMHGMVLASGASEHYRTDAGSAVLLPNVDRIREQILGLFEAPAPGVEPHQRCADVDAALVRRVAHAADAGVR